jgi:hypothetical protein
MRRGEFDLAWAISDAVLTRPLPADTALQPRHVQRVWDGRPVDNERVLVRCYHGLGDTLQFIRFMPLLRARALRVIVWVQRPLMPLVATVAGVDELLPLHDGEPDADFDVDVELMEVPHILRTTGETLPREIPYLHVEPEPLPVAPRPAIGLVWRAGDWAPERSIAFDLLRPLFDLPATWYILQGGTGLAERPAGFGTLRGTSDIVEAARTIRSLDLLITIDSMAAHLGGALGCRVWTLLPAHADWRWMESRDDSPWYPTMRLFRQERAGEWEYVVRRVAGELAGFVTHLHEGAVGR